MKRYSALVRKLVELAAQAGADGADVGEALKSRCFTDTGLVRQVLMNAVCDPRFSLYADIVGPWRREARLALVRLAESLDAVDHLTEEQAYYMLENFLASWFEATFGGAQLLQHPTEGYFGEAIPAYKQLEQTIQMLESIENDLKLSNSAAHHSRDSVSDDDEDVDACSHGGSGGEGEPPQCSTVTPTRQMRWPQCKSKTAIPRHDLDEQLSQVEETFLQRIPYSLVQLARKIGRMGEGQQREAGKFLTAAKSDIMGITTGNDITAVMPGQLALLAQPATHDVFLYNYAAGHLQLFASASQSRGARTHQDGPVVICVDTSGSMRGTPLAVARTLAIATAVIAWRMHRNVIVVKYADTFRYVNLGNSHSRLYELASFLPNDAWGGNDENTMFPWLFSEVLPNFSQFNTADTLCISDFGWAHINSDTQHVIALQKQQGMRFFGLNVFASVGHELPATSAMAVCDSQWVYRDGECRPM